MASFDRVTHASWFRPLAILAVALVGGCVSSADNTGVPSGFGSDGSDGTTGAAAGDGSACRPGEADTYQPDTYHSAAPAWRGVCTIGGPAGSGQDRGFFEACLAAGATPEQCTAFRSKTANDECANCIQTAEAARFYGPLIDNQGTFITTNVAGCIELTDLSALSCAKALQARSGCEAWACRANCPVHDSSSRAAYDGCAIQSDLAGCQSYDVTAACSNVAADGGPSAKCLSPSFVDFYYAVVPLFCGTRDSDAAVAADASGNVVSDAASVPSRDARTPSSDGAGATASADANADVATDAPADVAADARAEARADAAGDAGADASLDGPWDATIDATMDARVDAAKD